MKKIAIGIVFIFIAQLSFGQALIPYEENEEFGYKDSMKNMMI